MLWIHYDTNYVQYIQSFRTKTRGRHPKKCLYELLVVLWLCTSANFFGRSLPRRQLFPIVRSHTLYNKSGAFSSGRGAEQLSRKKDMPSYETGKGRVISTLTFLPGPGRVAAALVLGLGRRLQIELGDLVLHTGALQIDGL